MTLDPEHYECPEHGIDLTAQVQAKLNPDRPKIAFGQPPGPGPFKVVVLCGGVRSDGKDPEPHTLICTGKRT